MRIILDTPQSIEHLRKVYNDRVTFVSSVSGYPLISELEIAGDYLSALRKRLVPVRVGKRVDRLIHRYTRRLERVWNRSQRELLASLRLDHLKTLAPDSETEKADAPTLAQVLAETDPSRQQVLYMRYLKARREQLITPKLDAMREGLKRTAVPIFRNAYLLGKERGQVLTGQELDDELTDEDEMLLEEQEEQNGEFLIVLVDDVSDEYEKVLSEDYPTEEALLAALALAHQKEIYRLPKFAAALGSSLLAAGMAQAIQDVQELDEEGQPTGRPKIDEETGLPVGEIVEGGFWHTSHDNRVCDGCEGNEGFWMTLEDFQEEAGTNDCLSNCRCVELFEPAPMPTDESLIWPGTPGIDKGIGIAKHLPGQHDQHSHGAWAEGSQKPGPATEAPTAAPAAETPQVRAEIIERFGSDFAQAVHHEITEAGKHVQVSPAIPKTQLSRELSDQAAALHDRLITRARETIQMSQGQLAKTEQAIAEEQAHEAQGQTSPSLSWLRSDAIRWKDALAKEERTLEAAQTPQFRDQLIRQVGQHVDAIAQGRTLAEQQEIVHTLYEKAMRTLSSEWKRGGIGKEQADIVYTILRDKRAELDGRTGETLRTYLETHAADIMRQYEQVPDAVVRNARSAVEGGARTRTVTGRKNFQDGRDWLRANMTPELLAKIPPVTWEARRGSRSFYRPSENTITLAQDDRPGTIPHEFTHHLEKHIPEIGAFFAAYYTSRTRDESPVKLSRATGVRTYKSHEYTRPDQWANPYMGHTNLTAGGERHAGGEIFSTAVGMLANPQSAAELYRKDKELFGITISILKGSIPTRPATPWTSS